jgi:cellulose synthase/poly-beta-1,6-N-acetylglucosamine synthase-like glycosyltransferase
VVTLFVVFVLLSAYSYLLYPCLLLVLSKAVKRGWAKGEITPPVSVIISAYNEEAVIEQKVRNALALDYPEDRLEIIVSSDGSTDRTNEIVSAIKDPRLTLFAFPEREGKTACLNKSVPKAKGEIVLFTDANSMFPSDVLLKLVRNFADQDIGLVTGWTKYHKAGGGEETTGLYAKFEKWSKVHESLIFSCVGADGAVFAIKRSLYKPLQNFDINDFVIPLDVIRQKKRAVLDPEVFCFEEASEGAGSEYKRQVRITTRTLGAMQRNLEFLNPMKCGSFSFLLFSHKLMRFLVPFFFSFALMANALLLMKSLWYLLPFLASAFFLCWGALSSVLDLAGGFSSICRFLLATLSAQMAAWFRLVKGIKDITWAPQR